MYDVDYSLYLHYTTYHDADLSKFLNQKDISCFRGSWGLLELPVTLFDDPYASGRGQTQRRRRRIARGSGVKPQHPDQPLNQF